MSTKIKILLLSSNPKTTASLRLAEEFRVIRESFLLSKSRKAFEVIQSGAVRSQDLRRLILDESPNIVHFSGHGERDGVFLEDDNGYPSLVDGDRLKELFSLFKSVNCVVLNSCHSILQAQSLVDVVPYIISMKYSIEDSLAISFSHGFYDGIAAKRSIEDSFKFGINEVKVKLGEEKYRSLDLEATDYDNNIPVLFKGSVEKAFPIAGESLKKIKKYKKKLVLINKEHFQLREENTRIMANEGSFLENVEKIRKLKNRIPELLLMLNSVDNKLLPEKYLVAKYEMLSELTLMYSGLYAKDYQCDDKINKRLEAENYSRFSIDYGRFLLNIISKNNKKYIINDSKVDRTLYNISTAYGILISLGNSDYVDKIYSTLNDISEPYKEKNPACNNPFINSYNEV